MTDRLPPSARERSDEQRVPHEKSPATLVPWELGDGCTTAVVCNAGSSPQRVQVRLRVTSHWSVCEDELGTFSLPSGATLRMRVSLDATSLTALEEREQGHVCLLVDAAGQGFVSDAALTIQRVHGTLRVVAQRVRIHRSATAAAHPNLDKSELTGDV